MLVSILSCDVQMLAYLNTALISRRDEVLYRGILMLVLPLLTLWAEWDVCGFHLSFANRGSGDDFGSCAVDTSSPETIWLPGRFPKLDRSVFAASGVEFAVGRETYCPNRTVVTFACFCGTVSI